MHRPSSSDVRAGAGAVMLFAGTAWILLLTTTPPEGKHYPEWGFWVAGAAIVVGLVTIVFTYIFPSPPVTPIINVNLTVPESNPSSPESAVSAVSPAPPTSVTNLPDKGRALLPIADLLPPGGLPPIIYRQTIEDRTVTGPAILALQGSTLENCDWEGTWEAIIWPLDPVARPTIIGAIGTQGCVFRRCTFRGIGLVVPPGEMNTVRAGFGMDPSLESGG